MRLVAFDTETFLIRPGCLVPELVCVSAQAAGGSPADLWHVRGDALAHVVDWLKDPHTILVGHNVTYDLAVIVEDADRRGTGQEVLRLVFDALDAGRIRDTLIREYLIAIHQGTRQYAPKHNWTLAAMASRYLGKTLAKGEDTWRLRYGELVNTAIRDWPPEAIHYAKDDATTTLDVFLKQDEVFRGLGYLGAESMACVDEVRQVRAAWALHLMSAYGVRVDGPRLGKLAGDLTSKVHELEPALVMSGIMRGKDGSKDMKALRALVVEAYASAGLEVPRTATGNISTARETLEAVAAHNLDLADVVEYTGVQKILGTFVTAAAGGVLHPLNARFNPLVASGRTSSSGPNLQNLPRKDGIRQCFIPRPGYVFSSCDYSVLELRTLAQVCLDWGLGSQLQRAFLEGKDPHAMFGARLARVSYEDFRALPEAKEYRQRAKTLNFGKPGGLGADRLVDYARAYSLNLTRVEAQKLTMEWMHTWPEMHHYFKRIGDMEQGGFIQIEQVRSRRLRGGCRYTAACNTMFQGLAADGFKEACYEVTKEAMLDRRSVLWGSRPIIPVHDEIITEHPEETAGPAAQRVAQIMVEVMQRWTPDVPQIVEPALMRCWEKEATPQFDDDGNLVPWDGGEG